MNRSGWNRLVLYFVVAWSHVLSLLHQTLTLFWAGGGRFLLISFVLLLPLASYQLRVASTIAPLETRSFEELKGEEKTILFRYSLVVVPMAIILGQFVSGALAFGVLEILQGRKKGFFYTISAGFGAFFHISGTAVGVGILILLGGMFFLVPGLLALTVFFVAAPCAAVEGRGLLHSLRRSLELTRGHRLAIFWLFLSLHALVFLLVLAIGLFVGPGDVGRMVSIASSVLVAALTGTASALLYFRLRVVCEGLDLERVGEQDN